MPMRVRHPFYILLAATALWTLLAAFVPTGTYWRDSGEFILSAFYLDVAHPAGFPLYSQTANFFGLLPIGSIAWRVNSFSCLIGCINLGLLFLLTWGLLKPFKDLPETARICLSLIPACVLAFTAAFLRQSFTAEVYNLNALIILVLIILYTRYETTHDKRLLIVCGFLGGLGLGNHAALAVVLLPSVFIITSEFRAVKNILIPSLIAGVFGVAVYAYIPTRAVHDLPLNTGEASTIQRFIHQITDARDRALRAADSSAVDSSIVHLQGISDTALVRTVRGDVHTMQGESDSLLLITGVCGLLLLAIHRTRVALLLISSAGATWFFFLGWDADPWLPLFMAIGVGCAYLGAFVLAKFSARGMQQTLMASAALLAVVIINSPVRASEDLQEIRSFELPTLAAASLMERLPVRSVYISEASWFLLNYAQKIEGIREDIELIYQPSILFPDYFARIVLKDSSGSTFDSWAAKTSAQSKALPEEQNLADFTNYVTQHQTLGFEPNMILNRFFSTVAQGDARGYVFLERGKSSQYDTAFLGSHERFLHFVSQSAARSWRGFSADTSHFYETQLTNAAALLHASGSIAAARTLLAESCLWKGPSLCKLTSLNNLATYYMDMAEYRSAVKLLRSLQTMYPQSQAVNTNLAHALKFLEHSAVEENAQRVDDIHSAEVPPAP